MRDMFKSDSMSSTGPWEYLGIHSDFWSKHCLLQTGHQGVWNGHNRNHYNLENCTNPRRSIPLEALKSGVDSCVNNAKLGSELGRKLKLSKPPRI